DEVDPLLRRDAPSLVADDLLGDRDRAEAQVEAAAPRTPPLLEDRRLALLLRHRVPVSPERRDERGASVEVERAHVVRLAEVEIDRAVVNGRVGAGEPNRPEQGAGPLADHRNRFGARQRAGRPAGWG